MTPGEKADDEEEKEEEEEADEEEEGSEEDADQHCSSVLCPRGGPPTLLELVTAELATPAEREPLRSDRSKSRAPLPAGVRARPQPSRI